MIIHPGDLVKFPGTQYIECIDEINVDCVVDDDVGIVLEAHHEYDEYIVLLGNQRLLAGFRNLEKINTLDLV